MPRTTSSAALSLLLAASASGCRPVLYATGMVDTCPRVDDIWVTSAGEQLESGASFDSASDEAIVVVGVSRIYAMAVTSGSDDGVSWHRERRPSVATADAADGFVAFKLKPRHGRKRYAITAVALEPAAMDCYFFPDAATVLAFDAPRGKVTYLGGIDALIATEDGRSFAQLRANPAITKGDAALFMARRYPQIGNQLAPGRLEWLHKGEPR